MDFLGAVVVQQAPRTRSVHDSASSIASSSSVSSSLPSASPPAHLLLKNALRTREEQQQPKFENEKLTPIPTTLSIVPVAGVNGIIPGGSSGGGGGSLRSSFSRDHQQYSSDQAISPKRISFSQLPTTTASPPNPSLAPMARDSPNIATTSTVVCVDEDETEDDISFHTTNNNNILQEKIDVNIIWERMKELEQRTLDAEKANLQLSQELKRMEELNVKRNSENSPGKSSSPRKEQEPSATTMMITTENTQPLIESNNNNNNNDNNNNNNNNNNKYRMVDLTQRDTFRALPLSLQEKLRRRLMFLESDLEIARAALTAAISEEQQATQRASLAEETAMQVALQIGGGQWIKNSRIQQQSRN